MELGLIFKITAIGLIVACVNIILTKSAKEEYTLLTTITGIIIVIASVIDDIKELFVMLESLFNL